MEFGVFEILATTGLLILSFYYYLTSPFDYWKKRNVKGPKPVLIFGSFKDMILGRKHGSILLKEIYDDFKSEPLVGIYSQRNPVLIVKDLDLIRDVMVKDFSMFSERGGDFYEKAEPFCLHIFNLEYKRWKPLRTKFSPLFSSGKLREMFYLLVECAEHFQKYAELLAKNNNSVDCRDLVAKYATDSIGTFAFGVNTNSFGDEDSEFRKFGKMIFEPDIKMKIMFLLRSFIPQLYDFIGGLIQHRSNTFFEKCIRDIIDYRKKMNTRRNDFMDVLIDLKNNPEKIQDFVLTDQLLLSQAFIFFVAGFETTSTAMSNVLYELALNQDMQSKLRKEINEELAKCGGKVTYDSITNMSYLDKIVKESIRKYPPGATLMRKAVHSYTFNGTDVTIPEGMTIIFPIWAINRDPDIYPNPDKFDPERFSEKNEKSRHPMAYLPFGDGPHNCVATRFANYQTRIGLIAILEKIKVEACEKTIKEYRLVPEALIPSPIDGIHLKLTKI